MTMLLITKPEITEQNLTMYKWQNLQALSVQVYQQTWHLTAAIILDKEYSLLLYFWVKLKAVYA